MTDTKTRPQVSDKGLNAAELRRRRQAEALRANLSRRKAQSRGRTDEQTADTPAAEGDDAGTATGG